MNTSGGEIYSYMGASSTLMREQIAVHKSDSKNITNNTRTTLSAKIFNLMQGGIDHDVMFSKIERASSYSCNLCVKEAYNIQFNNTLRGVQLNMRQEMWAVGLLPPKTQVEA